MSTYLYVCSPAQRSARGWARAEFRGGESPHGPTTRTLGASVPLSAPIERGRWINWKSASPAVVYREQWSLWQLVANGRRGVYRTRGGHPRLTRCSSLLIRTVYDRSKFAHSKKIKARYEDVLFKLLRFFGFILKRKLQLHKSPQKWLLRIKL